MSSLGTKASGWLAAALVGAAFLTALVYAGYRRGETDDQAFRRAEALSSGLEIGLSEARDRGDAAAAQRLFAGALESVHFQALALVTKSGAVLASAPGVADGSERAHTDLCAGCHSTAGRPASEMVVRGAAGSRRVRLFRPLGPWGSEDPAYLVLEVTASDADPGDSRGMLLLFGVLGAAVLTLLGLFHGILSVVVVRPLTRLREEADRLLRGEAPVSVERGGSDEISAVEATLVRLGRRQAEFGKDVARLAEHLDAWGERVQSILARFRHGSEVGRTCADAVLLSVEQLDRTAEQIRSSLNSIAGSTSDNSTSLIELSASVDEVAENADSLAQNVASTASAVFEMVQSIQEVGGRVDVLARETDLTASSMAQIDASTRQIEQNARDAAELSGRMADAGQEGSEAVAETLRGIHASYEVIRETARAMEELGESSKAVDGVVKIINEINDKTKLLSLNAAIIAAQAGDHGKSFGVVAHEIKSLSDRTAMSTGEISRIIRGIRERIEAATEAVARGEDATGRSVTLAERAGGTLTRILETAQISHEMTRRILRATEEQSRGSQNVMAAMQEVSAMVTYIRQAALEHRTSGESVSQSAEVMRDLTEQVKLATAEQANVSRYISDAISAIDRNLQDLLQAIGPEKQGTEEVLGHVARLKEGSAGQGAAIDEAAEVLRELAGEVDNLRNKAAASLGEGGE